MGRGWNFERTQFFRGSRCAPCGGWHGGGRCSHALNRLRGIVSDQQLAEWRAVLVALLAVDCRRPSLFPGKKRDE